ncbi:MAG: alternative ribosome rescue aminoacyl-tRNA hydrolase ArfB [bacterium]|nr:alternative ribosome rescue aminoacyl-tRNA hydrolase ArfB [bacterium]
MLTEEQIKKILKSELSFQTSRSGGKGGQNVNKVETKVEIAFDVEASEALSAFQKQVIFRKYHDFVDRSLIKITGSRYRSQLENKEEAREKLITLINKLLKPVKKRVPTKPGKAAKQRKLQNKKHQSEKKTLRQKPH